MIAFTTPVPCVIEPTDKYTPPAKTSFLICRACRPGARTYITLEIDGWDIEVNAEDLIAAINKARGQ